MKIITKTALAILLSLCLCIGMVPAGMLSAGAANGDSEPVGFSPDNFKAQIKKVSIGAPITGLDGKKYLPVDVHFFAAENLSDSQVVHFLEGYLKVQLKDGKLAESIRGLGMTLIGPVKPDVTLDSNMWNWDWTPYDTGGGQGVIKYNVPLLENGETQTVEKSAATGMTEVNGVTVGDKITLQNETVVNTNGFPEQIVQELFPDGPSVFSDPVTFTIEDQSSYPKEITVQDKPIDCTHENKETKAEVMNVSGKVNIDGKDSLTAIIKDTDECIDCHEETVKKVYRLKFKNRIQMQKYLSGGYAKLSKGKKVHFKGNYEKVEKVYWNRKYIKVSKTYFKKKGSVILEFTDEFLASVENGTHELIVCNGDEFTAMTVKVQNHEMVELGAFDIDSSGSDITVDEYNALMQECEDNDIEIIDCDLDEFYANGFMADADDSEVAMNLSADTVLRSGKAVTPPAVTLTNEMGVEYAEDEDYTLTYYRVAEGADGELTEVEIAKEDIKDSGTYNIVATPTRNGVLSGEAQAKFVVIDPLLGDADGDGLLTISDVTAIQRHVSEYQNVNNFAAADVDGNGNIEIADATLVQRFLAEYYVEYPVGERSA